MRAGGDGPGAVKNGTSESVVPAERNPEGEINPPSIVGLLHFTEAPVDSMYRPPRLTPLLSHAERGLERLFGTSSTANEEEYPSIEGFETVYSRNGSTWYYAVGDDGTVTLTGYLQDVIPALYHLISMAAGPEDRLVYTSPATIAAHLEWAEADKESGELANASGSVKVGWSRDFETGFYRFDLHYANPSSRAALQSSIDGFADLIEHELTEVVEPPFSLGNMSMKLERMLREAHDTEILGMMKMTVPDIDPEDVAAWHQAIHEYPSGVSMSKNINDGVATDSDLFVRNIDIGIRMKEGLVTSVVWALNVNKGRLTLVASPRPDVNGFLWHGEGASPTHEENGNWASTVFEHLKGFASRMFKNGLKQVNIADINVLGVRRNSGGGSVPPAAESGGGEGGGAGNGSPPSGTPPAQEGKSTVTGLYYPEGTEAFSDGFGNNMHYRHYRIGARARAAALRTVQPGRAIQRPIAAPIARSALMITM